MSIVGCLKYQRHRRSEKVVWICHITLTGRSRKCPIRQRKLNELRKCCWKRIFYSPRNSPRSSTIWSYLDSVGFSVFKFMIPGYLEPAFAPRWWGEVRLIWCMLLEEGLRPLSEPEASRLSACKLPRREKGPPAWPGLPPWGPLISSYLRCRIPYSSRSVLEICSRNRSFFRASTWNCFFHPSTSFSISATRLSHSASISIYSCSTVMATFAWSSRRNYIYSLGRVWAGGKG